ncbi:MAG TPA: hypothetical protein VN278_06290 [Methanosarcina sp.]|nr:hypothetical protein [Methanosarcina sp.]
MKKIWTFAIIGFGGMRINPLRYGDGTGNIGFLEASSQKNPGSCLKAA